MLEIITYYLARPAMMYVDDIQANNVFVKWVKEKHPKYFVSFLEEWKCAFICVVYVLS